MNPLAMFFSYFCAQKLQKKSFLNMTLSYFFKNDFSIVVYLSLMLSKVCILTSSLVDSSFLVAPACNAGAPSSIPGSERSPGEGNGNPLQYSCLENLMDRQPGGLYSMGCKESDTLSN